VRVELDFTKSVHENAARYYEEAKRLREKAEGAEKAVKETEEKLRDLERRIAAEKEKPKVKVRVKKEKEWFEKFHWFRTSEGLLCIAGRDAKQNELLVARHLEEGDLFFHADIHGASATILKGGEGAGRESKMEAAQFAASYSSAWKMGSATVDVYAVKALQVSKRTEAGEYVGKGSFIIRGTREWFKNTPLGLLIGIGGKGVEVAPVLRGKAGFARCIEVGIGDMEKPDAAKAIARILGGEATVDDVLRALPSGRFRIESDSF